MIMEQARKALERYQNATQEFEKVQKLAQVRRTCTVDNIYPTDANQVLKNYSQ